MIQHRCKGIQRSWSEWVYVAHHKKMVVYFLKMVGFGSDPIGIDTFYRPQVSLCLTGLAILIHY
jgi:hypothetical protein